ncbi:MAG: FtsQ-type POTRA domain-containing protein [Clostridia bacterium]|nr:FtsQ-type POTRA domain-containing protein [Clostridia bacterium]MBQ2949003.1 FtsQ-type POTRA domain-containing protein [Clostridia bacterium]MBQ4608468.1 FtsQ-type POTRA domain-containing protein [Clostridia bacterium]
MRQRKRTKASGRVLATSIVVVAAVSVLLVLVCSQVFIIRDVMVVGNRNLLREEVVTQSGVEIGDNLLTITKQSLKNNLEANRYIEYMSHGFDYRGTLTININERLGMAVVYDLGYYYVLDETGMVLEVAGSAYPTYVAGPQVTGFAIEPNSRITVGEMLPVHDRGQLERMKHILSEMEKTNMLARTSQLDVGHAENMYAMTAEGASIVLGDDKNIRTKLLIAREVLTVREARGDLKGAKIDVSSGRDAHYIPATLPTITPVPTATPTPEPSATPR